MSQLIPDGTYPINNVFSGLTLKPEYDEAGANIVVNRDDGTDSFKWTFHCTDPVQNTYTITNEKDGLNAYAPENSPAGTHITMDNDEYAWTVSLVAGTTDSYNISLGSYLIYWSADSDALETPVILDYYNWTTPTSQQFKLS